MVYVLPGMSPAAIYLKQISPACFTFFLKKTKIFSAVLAGWVYLHLELSDTKGLNDLALLPLKNLFCVTCCVLEGLGKQFCRLLLSRVDRSCFESRVMQINHIIISSAEGMWWRRAQISLGKKLQGNLELTQCLCWWRVGASLTRSGSGVLNSFSFLALGGCVHRHTRMTKAFGVLCGAINTECTILVAVPVTGTKEVLCLRSCVPAWHLLWGCWALSCWTTSLCNSVLQGQTRLFGFLTCYLWVKC